jgi:hypothetical protein
MRHLTSDDFVAFAEGSLGADRAAHLATCDRCRVEARALASTLGRVREIEVPEPSPLFWDHFSARVRDAVEGEGLDSRKPAAWLTGRAGIGLIPVAAALVLVVALTLVRAPVMAPGSAGDVPLDLVAALPGPPPGPAALDADDASAEWMFVANLAEESSLDDVMQAGFEVGPGTTDSVVPRLSTDERRELVRLLETELGQRTKS